MAKVLSLSLASEQQLSFRHCGPAVIRMMLSRFGVVESQASLWAAVQANSAGGTAVPADGSLVLLFPKQVCHQCGAWFCWNTTPEAMAVTFSNLAPVGAAAAPSYPATNDAAVSELITSLERVVPFPPAATIRGSNHWVIMNGYHLDDPLLPGAPPIAIGNRMVNGVYVMDPFEGPTPLVTFVKASVWRGMLKSLDCGPRTNLYPIVVGRDRRIILKWWLYIVVWLRRWPPWPWRIKRLDVSGAG